MVTWLFQRSPLKLFLLLLITLCVVLLASLEVQAARTVVRDRAVLPRNRGGVNINVGNPRAFRTSPNRIVVRDGFFGRRNNVRLDINTGPAAFRVRGVHHYNLPQQIRFVRGQQVFYTQPSALVRSYTLPPQTLIIAREPERIVRYVQAPTKTVEYVQAEETVETVEVPAATNPDVQYITEPKRVEKIIVEKHVQQPARIIRKVEQPVEETVVEETIVRQPTYFRTLPYRWQPLRSRQFISSGCY